VRSRFDEQLDLLNSELCKMGALIEESIDCATKSLLKQNIVLARYTMTLEDKVDEKERKIEDLCLNLLLRQQPVARDLRIISAILKMITDMERIADQASDIAELAILLSDERYIKKLEHIPQMATATAKMVGDSIDAFVGKDLELARQVVEYDDVVDNLFDTIKHELIERITENKEEGEQAIDLLMISKYYERIGDHAVNIADWVIFSITGEHIKEPER
jgi:phosphate transport system protein